MKRLLSIIIISIFLIGVCVTEEIIVRKTLTEINSQGNELYSLALTTENLNTEEIITKTRVLKNFWIKYEDALCFFVNHKDMTDMGNEIMRMISYAQNNIKEEYTTSLELVLFYSSAYSHIMGVSFENIF